jgi:ubiquinone/menaquinone biosynthesis C-methylase UbiE
MSASYSEISFSTVAPRYNRINALPEEAAAQIGAALAGLLPPGAAALDMGCGAGRIAVPAAAAGLRVTGLDSDAAMLAEAARSAAEAGLALETIHGDITTMPLPADSFDAVLSINVLHLVPAWQQALAEAVRVMRPGGLLVQGRDWLDPASCAGQLRGKLREVVLSLEPGMRPTAAASPVVMAEALAQAGGVTEPDSVATSWTLASSPAEVLAQMAAREHNETWMLAPDLLAALLDRLHAWASSTWSDLDAPEPVERRFVLTVTRGLRG